MNMPPKCFEFNVYKQANVNIVIRLWQNYSNNTLEIDVDGYQNTVFMCLFICHILRTQQNFLVTVSLTTLCAILYMKTDIFPCMQSQALFSIDLMYFEWIINVFYTKRVDLKCILYQKGGPQGGSMLP